MKTIRSGLSNVLVLVLLAGLSVLLIALLSNANSGSTTSRPAALAAGNGSLLATPTIASARVSPLSTPNASSVPLAHIGAPVLVHASGPVGLLSGDQQKLVSTGRQGNKDYTTLLDLTTGKESKIADDTLPNVHLSGHWLAYEDHSPVTSTVYYSRIKVVDLDTGKQIVLGDEKANQQFPSISGDIVVWIDWRNKEKSNVDIYGYDLSKGQEFPIVVGPGPSSGPKISGKWVVYVEPTTAGQYLAELRVHALATGEDFSIGIIPAPQDATNGTYYAIDGDKVAWTKVQVDDQSLSALHLYNLTTRTDRQLTEQTAGEPSSGLSLSARGGIVVCGCAGQGWAVYDILQSPPIQVSITKPMTSPTGGYNLSIVGDNLVWWVGLRAGTFEANVYTVPISR